MTVTAISDRTRPPHRGRRPAAVRVPTVTVTFEIRQPDARLLEFVRELAGELGEGAVRVAAPVTRPVAAEPPAPDQPAPVVGLHAPRPADPDPTAARDGVVYVCPGSRTVLRDGQQLRLTRLEFDLLRFLADNPDRAFRRVDLLRGVWGYDQTGVRTVDVHVRRLRVKLGPQRPLVTTVHGVGYRLDERARVRVLRDGA